MFFLTGIDIKSGTTDTEKFFILESKKLVLAESGVRLMCETWWQGIPERIDNYSWRFATGVIRYSSITILDDIDFAVLENLKFLEILEITGTVKCPTVRDRMGNNWRDYSH